MKLRTLIVDDEPLARDRLRRLLCAEPGVEILAECGDGNTAVAAVREHAPDLLLLDIQMPGMDGFEVLRALSEATPPSVIFVTAFDQHAVKAFEARALDYLLKPVAKARLRDALSRARERSGSQPAPGLPQSLLDLLAERESLASQVRRFAIRNGERVVFIEAGSIDWVEAAGNYVVLHSGRESHILRETMGAIESQLAANAFLRLSRSAIVNLRRIRELQTISLGEHVAILVDGQRIPMTRSVREVEERMRFT